VAVAVKRICLYKIREKRFVPLFSPLSYKKGERTGDRRDSFRTFSEELWDMNRYVSLVNIIITVCMLFIMTGCQDRIGWNQVSPIKAGLIDINIETGLMATSNWASRKLIISDIVKGSFIEAMSVTSSGIARICAADTVFVVLISGQALSFDIKTSNWITYPANDVVDCSTLAGNLVLWTKDSLLYSNERPSIKLSSIGIVDVKMGTNNVPLVLTRDGSIFRISEDGELVLQFEGRLNDAHTLSISGNDLLIITPTKVYKLILGSNDIEEIFSLPSDGIVIAAYEDSQDHFWIVTTSGVFKYLQGTAEKEEVVLPFGVNEINNAIFSDGRLFIATNNGVYQLPIK
jgi:hypothetical protein